MPRTMWLLLFPAQKRRQRGGHCRPHGGQLRGGTGGRGAETWLEERGQPRSRGTGIRRREAPGAVASITHREDVPPRWVQKLPVSPQPRHPGG